MQGVGVPCLVRKQRSRMPPVGKNKPLNRNNIVTNLVKTLKMVYIKKEKEKLFKTTTKCSGKRVGERAAEG